MPPKVSVATITYQHENYIADAIESVLAQKTAFPIEMVIGEDCSKDRTRNIVKEYCARHPEVIRLLDHETNLGPHANFVATVMACEGEYIALLDGDDYWTAPDKLHAQVELMDANPDLSFCFHPARYVQENGATASTVVHPPGRRDLYRIDDLTQWLNIQTSTMLFRRSALEPFPDWFTEAYVGDWALQFLLAKNGDIGHIDREMSVYRLHGGGILGEQDFVRTSDYMIGIISLQGRFIDTLSGPRKDHFIAGQQQFRYKLAHRYIRERKRDEASRLIRQVLQQHGWNRRIGLLKPAAALTHLHFPKTYNSIETFWRNTRAFLGRVRRRVQGAE